MAKVKETKVALKGEDAKKAPKASKTARRVPPHHEEVKVESDSDSSNSESNSGSDTESEIEKQKSTKKPNVKKAAKTEPNSPPVPDDSSDDSDSDSSSSSSGEEGGVKALLKKAKANKKATTPATVTTNGTAKKSKELVSSSDDESSEEEESEAKAGPADEGSASDSDEEMNDAPVPAPAPKQRPAPVDPTQAIAPQPFNPPPGYKPLATPSASAETLTSLLANPSQKQIWHITAPSSVSLASIQTVSLGLFLPPLLFRSRDGGCLGILFVPLPLLLLFARGGCRLTERHGSVDEVRVFVFAVVAAEDGARVSVTETEWLIPHPQTLGLRSGTPSLSRGGSFLFGKVG